ncbi:hypothetical protein BJP34_33535 [Moorena producens PAL-8-15-08-1]|uniref:Uncharacterized protein n=1 Tax=Moorena producens PAL-8-15-08-1 TaxID=1458985 RepID=A0A1D8U1C9_9CYAN|nr:hypothetical protein BJP34_33535 [Moorena producens PAL-8-15-08-1]
MKLPSVQYLPTLPDGMRTRILFGGQIVRIDDEIAFGTEFAHPTLPFAIALVGWANSQDI